MANVTMVDGFGMGASFQDRRNTQTDVVSPITAADFAATQDMRTLDARLAAINAGYWTATRLRQDSMWDKLHYLRVSQYNSAGSV